MEKSATSYLFFVGIDLSKTSFDVSIINLVGKKLAYRKFKNEESDCFLFLKWVGEVTKVQEEILFCMEHTGIYGRRLKHFLQNHNQPLWLESGLQIKRSGGIQRGKNDKIDSYRIAIYAQEKQHKAEITANYDVDIEQMHDLLTTRNRLLKAHHALRTAQEELKKFDEISYQQVKEVQQEAIRGIEKSIKITEEAIDRILDNREEWKKNVVLTTSIKGVGKLTALWFIVYTNNFDNKYNARKIAAFIGIAPYENSSGTTVDKGTHISKFAHLQLKALLHTAVLSAIRFNPNIKDYYIRKKAEGKKGFIVLNNAKNKLVHQMVAIVRSGVEFDPTYKHPKIAA